jgi:hypothetical protein
MFSATKGGSPSGYQISRSVRLRESASAYFDRSVATSGNRRKWTVSCWVKRGILGGTADRYLFTETNEDGSGADIKYAIMRFTTTDRLELSDRWASAGDEKITTTAVFRDPSAWYHVVFVRDSDNATAADRAIIYVNGVRQAVTGSFTQSKDSSWNLQTTAAYGQEQIGRFRFAGTWYYGSDFYMTEVNSIDGQALTPASFGETNPVTGVWQPKKYTGTYGTNGFYLNFSDNSAATAAAIGKDYSGNGNNWTPNNISVTAGATYDSMLDVPTQWADGGNGRGNYAVLNPLQKGSSLTVTNGNLDFSASGTASNVFATMPFTGGKFYFEVTFSTVTAASWGIATKDASITANIGAGGFANFWGFYCNPTANYVRSATNPWNNGTITTSSVGQIAVDATNPANVKMWIGVDNTWYNSSGGTTGNPATGSNATETLTNNVDFFPFFGAGNSSPAWSTNFGQRPFSYTPPTGFKALNTLNLPTPTILKGNQYFDATIYTGSTGTNNIVNSGGMAPDLVWVKSRAQTYPHYLFDVVRGTGATALSSNNTAAQGADGTAITSFNSNGFTFTGNSGANDPTFANGYIGWQWKANGTPAVTNTAGSITSQVSAGGTQGFSVVTYTGNATSGATVGHGLGVAPSFIIAKNRSSGVTDWPTYHISTGNNGGCTLNETAAKATTAIWWNNTTPSSTVVTLGNGSQTNGSTNLQVLYCFAAVAGYSAFGSYAGNGSADGTFVFTGFRPRYVLIKCSSAGSTNWILHDTAREPYNLATASLYPNLSNAETVAASQSLDILSNGFKLRNTSGDINSSGATYIYAAFAENPFKNSLAR